MRAFEMPPHARISLTQQLLLRATVARFWRKPYEPPAGALGTELHDRYLMPYFVRSTSPMSSASCAARVSICTMIGLRRTSNFAFRNTATSRCAACSSNCARRSSRGMSWARRVRRAGGALRGFVGGTPAGEGSGLAPNRYAVTCNGRLVPLRPTGTVGEFVGAYAIARGSRLRRCTRPSACMRR